MGARIPEGRQKGLEGKGRRIVVGRTQFGACTGVLVEPASRARQGGAKPRTASAALGH